MPYNRHSSDPNPDPPDADGIVVTLIYSIFLTGLAFIFGSLFLPR
jgi:hypothetical protein